MAKGGKREQVKLVIDASVTRNEIKAPKKNISEQFLAAFYIK